MNPNLDAACQEESPMISMNKRGLYHHIVSDVAKQILSGAITSGKKLPTELELCEKYSVSRTVVRDAQRILTDKGLVEARPRRGVTVRAVEHWNFLDPDLFGWAQETNYAKGLPMLLVEARLVVEPQIVALAAKKASPEEAEKIEFCYRKMAAIFEQEEPDIETYNRWDIEFHLTILNSTHNLVLKQFGKLIIGAVQESSNLNLKLNKLYEDSLFFHGEIAEAIKRNDPDKAEKFARKIIGLQIERMNSD